MARRDEGLIPRAVRIALRNAVGGWGPYTVREIEDLFNSHGFDEQDLSVPEEGGERRTAAEQFHARIDWHSTDEAQRYLELIAEVLERYPEENDEPGSPGWSLRRALHRGDFVGSEGRLRLPSGPPVRVARSDLEAIWTPDRPRLFLSHVHEVRRDVGRIAEELESLQCSCFVAHVQIEPSRDWQDAIEAALATCDALVAYVTLGFPQSRWTDQEVGWVLGRGLPVIPVNAGLQPYGLFGSRQSLPTSRWPAWVAFDIFRVIVSSSLRAEPPPGSLPAPLVARTVVRAFCQSPSYDSTRQRFPLLRLIPLPLWTGQMLEELHDASQYNSQIYDAGLNDPQTPASAAVEQLISRVARMEAP